MRRNHTCNAVRTRLPLCRHQDRACCFRTAPLTGVVSTSPAAPSLPPPTHSCIIGCSYRPRHSPLSPPTRQVLAPARTCAVYYNADTHTHWRERPQAQQQEGGAEAEAPHHTYGLAPAATQTAGGLSVGSGDEVV